MEKVSQNFVVLELCAFIFSKSRRIASFLMLSTLTFEGSLADFQIERWVDGWIEKAMEIEINKERRIEIQMEIVIGIQRYIYI